MGTYSIIDDDPNKAQRCLNVKLAVVLINLIGAPVSLIFLIYCIVRMIRKKKQVKILTTIILLIFFSEVVQCISKLLQPFKYFFEDRRKRVEYKMFGRAIICQFQIVLAVYSDYCSLICTFLLSLKCYDALRYKNKYFSNDNRTKKKIILYTILGCLLAALLFLLLDRYISQGNVNYKYDSRDRCSYWCWLGHYSSITCLVFYWVILIANIVLSGKTFKFLSKKQRELSEGNEHMLVVSKKMERKYSNNEEENNDSSDQDDYSQNSSHRVTNYNAYNKDSEQINDLILIKIKCTIYPLVTIFIWLLFAIYRLVDDIIMNKFDSSDSEDDNNDDESEYFDDHPTLAIVVQTFLVIFTFFSSTRGLFYGASFIVFEEKMFGSFFRKWFGAKNDISSVSTPRVSEIKISNVELSEKKYNEDKEEEENNEEEEENNDDDENDDSKNESRDSENVEMNSSEIRLVEK